MTFKSIREERESLKVKIHTLECIRDAKGKPLEYWLAAAKEGLKEIYDEESYKRDFVDKELLTFKEQVRKTEELKEEADKLKEEADKLKEEADKLKEEAEKRKEEAKKRKEIEDIRAKAQDLIPEVLEKYRRELVVKDAILLKEPEELEDTILHIFDRHFFTSKFFYIQVFILLAVIYFAGFGTWQLFSGAKRAGDMVLEMENKVSKANARIDTMTDEANTQIDTITYKLEELLTKTATDQIADIEGKVVNNLTSQIEPNVIARIDKEFETTTAEQRVDAVIDKRVKPIIERNEENINKLNLQPLRQKLDVKTKQMQSLEEEIDKLEQRIQDASKDIQFSVFGIWAYMDWFLKTSLILFYLLLFLFVVLVVIIVISLIKEKLTGN